MIKILLLGFDTRVCKAFEVFFATKCNGIFSIETQANTAPIAIIDFDIFHNKSKISRLVEDNPKIIIFGLSLIEQSNSLKNVYFLKKPINYLDLKKELIMAKKAVFNNVSLKRKKISSESFISSSVSASQNHCLQKTNDIKQLNKSSISHSTSAANTLSKQEESHFVGNNKDVDLSNPQELLKVLYSTERKMQRVVLNAIKQARKLKSSVQVVYLGFEFIVEPVKELIYTVSGNSVLRPLCLLDTKETETLKVIKGKIKASEVFLQNGKSNKKLIKTNIDSFLWKVSLWSSRGRLPNTIDINTPAYLSEWPNLTRLDNFPQAMRIAAYLIKQPCKLGDIAIRLNIPQRYVFSFFSAAHAIGIAGISVRKIDSTFTSKIEPKNIAPRSFLSKILGKLIGTSVSTKDKVAN